MRSRLLPAILVTAVGGTLLIGGVGSAGAHRADAPTTITIIPESDGFYGYVKSPKTQKCANNRKIKVVSDKTGKTIGSDIAQPNNNGIEWNIGQPGHMKGKFHAVAHAIPGCKKGVSESVKMT